MKIEVYTDGSATIASKPGGYGWVLVVDEVKHSEGSGHIPKATNNDAEMEAAIHGLAAAMKFINSPEFTLQQINTAQLTIPQIVLCSDSQITLNWANGTYRFKQEAKYQRFAILKELMARLNAQTRWVRGHAGHEHNERCDFLAGEARKGMDRPVESPKRKHRKISAAVKTPSKFSLRYKDQTFVLNLELGTMEAVPGVSSEDIDLWLK